MPDLRFCEYIIYIEYEFQYYPYNENFQTEKMQLMWSHNDTHVDFYIRKDFKNNLKGILEISENTTLVLSGHQSYNDMTG